jgi:hypothetical protein
LKLNLNALRISQQLEPKWVHTIKPVFYVKSEQYIKEILNRRNMDFVHIAALVLGSVIATAVLSGTIAYLVRKLTPLVVDKSPIVRPATPQYKVKILKELPPKTYEVGKTKILLNTKDDRSFVTEVLGTVYQYTNSHKKIGSSGNRTVFEDAVCDSILITDSKAKAREFLRAPNWNGNVFTDHPDPDTTGSIVGEVVDARMLDTILYQIEYTGYELIEVLESEL